MKSYVLVFADDTILFKQVTSEEDSVMLQHDIDALDDWTKNWLLKFDADKSHVLTMGTIEEIKYMPRYNISQRSQPPVQWKRLGLPQSHMLPKVNKANAGLIR